MRRAIIALTIASAGLLVAYAGAEAQVLSKPDSSGKYIVPGSGLDSDPKPVGPRVYGYYEAMPAPETFGPDGPGGCGTYFYWNGERCVDARNKR
jgi:hypothetical protein